MELSGGPVHFLVRAICLVLQELGTCIELTRRRSPAWKISKTEHTARKHLRYSAARLLVLSDRDCSRTLPLLEVTRYAAHRELQPSLAGAAHSLLCGFPLPRPDILAIATYTPLLKCQQITTVCLSRESCSDRPLSRALGSKVPTLQFALFVVSWTSWATKEVSAVLSIEKCFAKLTIAMFPSNTIPLQQHPAGPDFAAPRTTIADALRSPPHAKVLLPSRKLLSRMGHLQTPTFENPGTLLNLSG